MGFCSLSIIIFWPLVGVSACFCKGRWYSLDDPREMLRVGLRVGCRLWCGWTSKLLSYSLWHRSPCETCCCSFVIIKNYRRGKNENEDSFKPKCFQEKEKGISLLLLLSGTQGKTDINIPGQFVNICFSFSPTWLTWWSAALLPCWDNFLRIWNLLYPLAFHGS